MKKEILFRGKTIRDGYWIFGSLWQNEERSMIYVKIENGTSYWETVNPETVGQFTGLTDKNGVKIFEGDILKIKNSLFIDFDMSCCETTDNIPEVYEDSISEVVFSDGAFCITEPNTESDCPIRIYEVKDVEVIGNIHDNKNLLK